MYLGLIQNHRTSTVYVRCTIPGRYSDRGIGLRTCGDDISKKKLARLKTHDEAACATGRGGCTADGCNVMYLLFPPDWGSLSTQERDAFRYAVWALYDAHLTHGVPIKRCRIAIEGI